jgi:hypothetical protein
MFCFVGNSSDGSVSGSSNSNSTSTSSTCMKSNKIKIKEISSSKNNRYADDSDININDPKLISNVEGKGDSGGKSNRRQRRSGRRKSGRPGHREEKTNRFDHTVESLPLATFNRIFTENLKQAAAIEVLKRKFGPIIAPKISEFRKFFARKAAYSKIHKWVRCLQLNKFLANKMKSTKKRDLSSRKIQKFVRRTNDLHARRMANKKIKRWVRCLQLCQCLAGRVKLTRQRKKSATKIQKFIRYVQMRNNSAFIISKNIRNGSRMNFIRKQKFIHKKLQNERERLFQQMGRSDMTNLSISRYTVGQKVIVLSTGNVGTILEITKSSTAYKYTYTVQLIDLKIQKFNQNLIQLAGPFINTSPILDVTFNNLSDRTKAVLDRASSSLDPVRRALKRRTRLVTDCISELLSVWDGRTPCSGKLLTPLEKIAANLSISRCCKNLDSAAEKVLLLGNGFYLDLYEERIEYWTKCWGNKVVVECCCCNEWMTIEEVGYEMATVTNHAGIMEEKKEGSKWEEQKGEHKMECSLSESLELCFGSETSCNHGNDMCRNCLKTYFTLQMSSEEVSGMLPMYGIRCPKNCKVPIQDVIVQQLLGDQVFSSLAGKMRARRINSRKNLRFCPNQGCGMEIPFVGSQIVILYSPPQIAANALISSQWNSVTVVELLPGDSVTKSQDKYRVEFQHEDWPSAVLELKHLPSILLTSLPATFHYFFFEKDHRPSIPKMGAKFLPGEIVQDITMKDGPFMCSYLVENVFNMTGVQGMNHSVYLVKKKSLEEPLEDLQLMKENELQRPTLINGIINLTLGMRKAFESRRPKIGKGMIVNKRAVIDMSCGSECWRCHNSICLECGASAHGNASCDEHAKVSLRLISQDREKFVQCPKCRGVLERKSGCDHMTCRSEFGHGCGAEFCFMCLKMEPHCGTKCKRPDVVKKLRRRWKRERVEKSKEESRRNRTEKSSPDLLINAGP